MKPSDEPRWGMGQQRWLHSRWTRWQVATVGVIGANGLFCVLTAMAAPATKAGLRDLDPKTGLPKTWDSRVGRLPVEDKFNLDFGRGKRPAPKPHRTCQTYGKADCSDQAFVAKCPNVAQACKSFQELDACANNPSAGSSCGTNFYNAHKAEIDGVPKAKRVVPSRRSLGTESKKVGFVKTDRAKVTVKGMDHAFATRLSHPSVSGAGGGSESQHLTHMKKAIDKIGAGGNVTGLIDSCDEYAARKYLSLTQFDAEVSKNQRDPRKTYDLIYSKKWESVVSQRKVLDSEGKVAGIAPKAELAATGEILPSKVEWIPLKLEASISEARNAFLGAASGFGRSYDSDTSDMPFVNTTNIPDFTNRKEPIATLGLPDFAPNSPIKKEIETYVKKQEIFFNQAFFRRKPVTGSMVTETFDWHKAKNNALRQNDEDDKPGRFTDEELRIRYDKQHDLSALVARRNEIAGFVRDVGDICRTKPKPAHQKKLDSIALGNLGAELKKIADTLESNPYAYAEFTSKKGFTQDAALDKANASKGFTIYDPIAGTERVVNHGYLVAASKSNSWVPDASSWYGSSCRSQTGCPVRANAVTAKDVLKAHNKAVSDAANAAMFNANLDDINAKQDQSYEFQLNGVARKCKEFGIPKLFKQYKQTASDSDYLFQRPPPSLSADEAQVVADALKKTILPKLESVDSLIAEQLTAGIELDCFRQGANGCDWSPNRLIDFAHKYRRQIDVAREADAQRCKRYTTHSDKEGFSVKARLKDLTQKYPWSNARKSVRALEEFLFNAEAEVIRQVVDMISAMIAMQAYDDDGHTPALGQMTSTDGGFGSDMFGAEYSAGGGFRFGNLSTGKDGKFSAKNIGEGKTWGTARNFTYWGGNYANASVKILGSTNEVFNARMDIALTRDKLLEPQRGINKADTDHLKDYLPAIQKTRRDDHVQGHLHIRVAGEDLFDPVDHAVQPTFYASTEPLYSFEPASYEKTIFDVSTTFTVVIVPVTLRGWATFHAGLNYSINAALDRDQIDSLSQSLKKAKNPTPFQMSNTIEPYAEVDGNISVGVGVPGCEVGVKGSLKLIRIGLPYTTTAAVRQGEGGKNSKDLKSTDNRFMADQGLDLTLSTLSGTVSGFVDFLLWSAEAELFSWDGLTSTTPIFNITNVDASVAMASEAVRQLVAKPPGFKLEE